MPTGIARNPAALHQEVIGTEGRRYPDGSPLPGAASLGPTARFARRIRRMQGLMMDYPLTVNTIFRRAETMAGPQAIVSRLADTSLHRYTYAEFAPRDD